MFAWKLGWLLSCSKPGLEWPLLETLTPLFGHTVPPCGPDEHAILLGFFSREPPLLRVGAE